MPVGSAPPIARFATRPIMADLHVTRNMRLAFKDGFLSGGIKAGLMTLTRGAFPGGRMTMPKDADTPRRTHPATPFVPDNVTHRQRWMRRYSVRQYQALAFRRTSSSARDVTPVGSRISRASCPLGVYERDGDILRVNAPNCVDCKATDVLGPRWTPREGGSGPKYR